MLRRIFVFVLRTVGSHAGFKLRSDLALHGDAVILAAA